MHPWHAYAWRLWEELESCLSYVPTKLSNSGNKKLCINSDVFHVKLTAQKHLENSKRQSSKKAAEHIIGTYHPSLIE